MSGDWLEQLAYDWPIEKNVKPECIARNIHGGDVQQTDSHREADLLIYYKKEQDNEFISGVSSIVEIKAGLPPGKPASDLRF